LGKRNVIPILFVLNPRRYSHIVPYPVPYSRVFLDGVVFARALQLARITSPFRSVGGDGASSTRVQHPLASAARSLLPTAMHPSPSVLTRLFTMEPVTSTLLRDLSPNWNNQLPRETALLDDCYSASDNYSFTDDDCGFTSDDECHITS
jgi:hypothetical protein